MAKKKQKLHHKLKKIHKNKQVRKRAPLGLLPIGLILGLLITKALPQNLHPKTIVWAASQEVKVPSDLVTFLKNKSNCKDETGVSLWSVFKVSQEKFAKLSYGCSYDLSFYQMAVKQDGKWQLLDTKTYFANNFLPKCSEVDTYQIDKSIEPFCIDANNGSRENGILAK